ncbi:MAG: hypothetical protein AAB599_02065 [Patescibacteria group bacterium]
MSETGAESFANLPPQTPEVRPLCKIWPLEFFKTQEDRKVLNQTKISKIKQKSVA